MWQTFFKNMAVSSGVQGAVGIVLDQCASSLPAWFRTMIALTCSIIASRNQQKDYPIMPYSPYILQAVFLQFYINDGLLNPSLAFSIINGTAASFCAVLSFLARGEQKQDDTPGLKIS